MTTATAPPRADTGTTSPPATPTPRGRVTEWALVALAAGWAVVAAADGAAPWRVVRVLLVLAAGAGLLARHRRHPGRGTDAVLLVVGTASVTAGVVLGLRVAAATGVGALAVGGLVVMVAGGVVLVGAAARRLRASHGWWRALALPVTAALALGVAYPVAIATFATNVPRPTLGGRTPADVGLTAEDVAFTTADGVTLRGWYVPSRNGAAVVLAHGASSTRTSVLDQAAAIADGGYGVLLFDARGHGESDGRAMELGWYGDLDVRAAVDHLAARPDVDPDRIGAVGMSMGGEEVIGAAAADPRIAVVVAEGATGRTRDDKGWLPGGPAGWLQRGMDVLTFGLTDLLTDASPPISLRAAVAAAAPRPVVLLAGEGEEDAAAHIAAGSPATVTVVATGAAHVAGLDADPETWRAEVLGALDETLTAHGTS